MGQRKPIDSEAYEERAAILEFDAGFTRAEAERLALAWQLEENFVHDYSSENWGF